MKWIHSRKGEIDGDLVRQDGEWMWVRLTGDHTLRYMSEYNRGQVDEDGEVLCLRRSLMRPVSVETVLVCGCIEPTWASPACDIHRRNPNLWKS